MPRPPAGIASRPIGGASSCVIDYTSEAPLQPRAGYDVIFDTPGVASFSAARPALAETGR